MSVQIFDLGSHGRIKVTGDDRARLLHAMTTNHVQDLKPGEGLYAFFLNAQGRIQADVHILCFDDYLLLDTEPEVRGLVFEHLDRYIIADDAYVEDATETTFCLAVEGAGAAELVASAGLVVPTTRFGHISADGVAAAALTVTGAAGIRLYGPIDAKENLVARLVALGATTGSPAEAEIARIQNFVPRFGADITAATLPQESQMMHAIHFQKGCYLGQEIVERVRSRGHVNRTLMGFRLEGESAPAPTTPLTVDGKETGEVTSSVATAGGVSGLAYVRVPHNKSGATVSIDGRAAQLFAPAGI